MADFIGTTFSFPGAACLRGQVYVATVVLFQLCLQHHKSHLKGLCSGPQHAAVHSLSHQETVGGHLPPPDEPTERREGGVL